jgi:hypothetical protein
MKKQVFYSFVLAILSFITVRHIHNAGIEQYHFLQSPVFQKENGWFDLNNPSVILSLPYELREVSGLTKYSYHELACIQDDAGTIYIYDLNTKTITKTFNFDKDGSFDGLSFVDSSFYILKSNATLMSLKFQDTLVQGDMRRFKVPAWENDGLCFDAKDNRLLVAPKSKIHRGPAYASLRGIYSVDLLSGKLNQTPLFEIDVNQIKDYAISQNIPLPARPVSFVGDSMDFYLDFIPSSIAVHPKTDEIYVISSIDRTLTVFDKTGNIQNFVTLDPTIFNKPEEITFLPDGDLIVTNVGVMGTPTLIRFDWKLSSRNI